MPGKAAKVVITERQQEILQRWVASRSCPRGLAQRAEIILLAFARLQNGPIAERLGCERHAVGMWRRRWADAFDILVRVLADQNRVILGIDGLQPDVGHEVLWVVRDCLSGEVLAARAMLSARRKDLIDWLSEGKKACPVTIAGIVSDGQHTIRQAVGAVFPDVPYQLCQFHYLREAARPIYEVDRHAKKELKKKVHGVRGIERQVEERTDAEAEVVRGYCSAVRSALTDDGRPPLEASGLKLHARLTAIDASLERAAEKGGYQPNCNG